MVVGMAVAVSAQNDHARVLFIGNSYTDVNNLPNLVQRVSESAGCAVEYESYTPGGCTFMNHCNNQSINLIRQGGWDVVVLQEQSQLPSFPQSQVEQECFPYAEYLVNTIYQYNPDGEAMFYMTWGRKNGDERNAPYFPVLATYEGMDSMIYERYMYMARTYDASVCPVGRVWRYIRNNHADIELYQPDDSHPSVAGSYAAACAFYTLIFHRSPLEITHVPDIDGTQAATIRQAVKTVVFDNLSFWLRQNSAIDTNASDTTIVDTTITDTTSIDTTTIDTTHLSIANMGKLNCSIIPNPAHGQVRIAVEGNCAQSQCIIFDPCGRKVRSLTLAGKEELVDISSLPAGVYAITILSGQDKVTRRLVIK